MRVFHKSLNVAGDTNGSRAGALALQRGPRFTVDRSSGAPAPERIDGKKTLRVTVGLGPSHATRACERVSLAMQRSRGTGPRATVKAAFIATIAGDRSVLSLALR